MKINEDIKRHEQNNENNITRREELTKIKGFIYHYFKDGDCGLELKGGG